MGNRGGGLVCVEIWGEFRSILERCVVFGGVSEWFPKIGRTAVICNKRISNSKILGRAGNKKR